MKMDMITGVASKIAAVTFGEDNPFYGDRVSVIFCTSPGTVVIEDSSGVQTSKAMVAGEYWRFHAKKFVSTPNGAVVQVHG